MKHGNGLLYNVFKMSIQSYQFDGSIDSWLLFASQTVPTQMKENTISYIYQDEVLRLA
jgi:hypothetical protein